MEESPPLAVRFSQGTTCGALDPSPQNFLPHAAAEVWVGKSPLKKKRQGARCTRGKYIVNVNSFLQTEPARQITVDDLGLVKIQFFLDFDTVVFSFLFNKYCPIIIE